MVALNLVECATCGLVAADRDPLDWALAHTREVGHPTTAHQEV